MERVATLVSARVDHDAAAWIAALRALGYHVRSAEEPAPDALGLVVVHDPVLLAAPSANAHVVRWRDLPGQRRDLPATTAVADFPNALHVTTSLHARRELESRGVGPVACLPDAFDLDPAVGDRTATRRDFDFADGDIVLMQPTIGHERKNVAGAIRYANQLATVIRNRPLRLWIKGPIDPDHHRQFERLVEHCAVPVTIGEAASAADAFAACDVAVFPAAWDPFGDVVLEAVAHRRPIVTSDFPVLAELVAGGIRVLPIDDPVPLVQFLAKSESARRQHLDATARRARVSYSLSDFTDRVGGLLATIEAAKPWSCP